MNDSDARMSTDDEDDDRLSDELSSEEESESGSESEAGTDGITELEGVTEMDVDAIEGEGDGAFLIINLYDPWALFSLGGRLLTQHPVFRRSFS